MAPVFFWSRQPKTIKLLYKQTRYMKGHYHSKGF